MKQQQLAKLVRPNIAKLDPYVCARHNLDAKGILLDANESPYGKLNRYPDPLATEVRCALSKYLQINPENIFVGNGSDEAIDLLFRCFCEQKKDQVYIPEPTYGMYKVCADINEVKIVNKITSKTKLIFLCSPNNPTGQRLNTVEIFGIIKNFPGLVILDEAYVEFSTQPSLVSEIKNYPNLVILRTLSKAWAAAGIRLGYAVANPFIIETLNKVKAPYNVNVLTQKTALKILNKKNEMLKKVKQIFKERKRVEKQLKKLKFEVFPSDANFLLFKIPQAKNIQKKLQEKGLVIRDRSSAVPHTLRVTIGTKKQNNLFLKELKNALEKIAFIDRDGVILFEPQDDFQVDSLEKYKILPGVIQGLKKLQKYCYKLVMVSNQNGIGTTNFPEENFLIVQNQLLKDLAKAGIQFTEIFICPHLPGDNCNCRKPKIGLVENFLKQTPINYSVSFMIGDRDTDMQFAKNIGVRGCKLITNKGLSAEFIFSRAVPELFAESKKRGPV